MHCSLYIIVKGLFSSRCNKLDLLWDIDSTLSLHYWNSLPDDVHNIELDLNYFNFKAFCLKLLVHNIELDLNYFNFKAFCLKLLSLIVVAR